MVFLSRRLGERPLDKRFSILASEFDFKETIFCNVELQEVKAVLKFRGALLS